jgi:HK97 family phage major capsid protein
LGAAAHEFVVIPSGEVGSIGVFAMHIDVSKALEEFGITVTLVSAGKHKTEGNPFEALSEEARSAIQASVDDYYGMFTRAVAKYRGVSTKEVREGMGEGRVMTAQKAQAAGLVDRVATLETVLAELGVRVTTQGRDRDAKEKPLDVAAAVFDGRYTEQELDKAALLGSSDLEPQGILELEPAARWSVTVSVAGMGTPALLAQEDEDEDEDDEPDEEQMQDDEDEEDEEDAEAAGGALRVEGHAANPPAPGAKGDTVKKDTDTAPAGAAGNGTATIDRDAGETERKRCQDIVQLCAAHAMPEKVSEFIEQGWSVDRVGREILGIREAERPGSTLPEGKPPVTLTEKENKRYSLARFALASANGRPEAAGFEWEIHEQLQRDLNYAPKGIMVPTTLGIERQAYRRGDFQRMDYRGALTTDTTGGGEELVFIEPGSFIELLRSRLVAAAMGATFLPGLRGNVDFPKQTGAGEFSWVPESNTAPDQPDDSDLDTGIVSLRPKNGRSITSFSRTLLAQSVVNVEQLIRADLAAITARGIDRSALHGTGENNQPTGIYVASGVNPVAFDGAVSYAKVVEMETRIAENDADIERMGYVSTPGVRGGAKTTLTFSEAAAGMPIWTGGVRDGQMNGYRAMASTQIRKDLGAGSEHGLVFGAWEHLLIGEWGAMDILADPYTRGGRGLIRMIVFSIADVALRYAEAFSKATSLTVASDAS